MIYRAKVAKVTAQGVFVEIADLGVGVMFGPCESVLTGLKVNDFVLCLQIDGAKEDVVIVGALGREQTTAPIPVDGYTIGTDTDGVPFYNISINTEGDTILQDTDGVPYYEDSPFGNKISIDTDFVPYYNILDNSASNSVSIDTDGVPYYDISGSISMSTISFDDDGVPYYDTTGTGNMISFDTDGVPYIEDILV